jgi:hypothetical protein
MIFKTKDANMVAYLRACQAKTREAHTIIKTESGPQTVKGRVISIAQLEEPEPIWEVTLQPN